MTINEDKTGTSIVKNEQPQTADTDLALIDEIFCPSHWIARLGTSAVLLWFLYEIGITPFKTAGIFGVTSSTLFSSFLALVATVGALSTVWNWRLLDQFIGFFHGLYEEIMEKISARANAHVQARREPKEVRKRIEALTHKIRRSEDARKILDRFNKQEPLVAKIITALKKRQLLASRARQALNLTSGDDGLHDALEDIEVLEEVLRDVEDDGFLEKEGEKKI